ncbi:cellulose binding domain-containing protein [Micromonospora sp. WMMD714]|uniref:poly(ethylene terephthalate) hydrolase family protein n=1 Tax=Micromonospora sp. WMMD714 TaxID=3016097 RepID=UPI00249ACFDD|nr:cellulose binding domain-containing protein [Micromonospora sp. WMMD714]WFE62809.1 cellulose binding domain-containing protein [Micromonospora sp. WMMD714]
MNVPTARPPAPGDAPRTRSVRRTGPARWLTAGLAVVLGLTVSATTPHAAVADSPYQRGPDPTLASVAATRGPFATTQATVPAGNGFNGGFVYYPTDTSLGTWGAVAIVPGYSALFANEEAWMGPWLASFGFVVLGIETNSRTDGADARATQLLAGLDYLTRTSPVRSRVDANRLGVMGHSAGGAGTLLAALRRPSLKTAVGLAPGTPGNNLNMSTTQVPTLLLSGQNDGTVTPSYVQGIYNTLPANVEHAWAELAGNDHLSFTRSNPTEMRLLIPWLKIFLDSDTRYTQFLCPLADSTGVSRYSSTCPLVPSGGPTPPPTTTPPPPTTTPPPTSTPPPPTTTPPPPTTTPPAGTACTATYRTVNSWSGGFQAEVTVTAGTTATDGWTVRWNLGAGQSVSQVWNGTLSTSGTTATVRNAAYNGTLAPGTSTTFGFLGTGTPSSPSPTCTSP